MKLIRYPGLNGLRAISVTIVLLSHIALYQKAFAGMDDTWFSPFLRLFTNGSFGVNVFFEISGFLITSLLLNEEAGDGTISIKRFYLRRTFRIFPAYYFVLLVYLILQIAGIIKLSGASWISSLTYTKYFNWTNDVLTPHFWSLSVEEHFYLFWPLVFRLGDSIRKKVAIGLFLIVPIIRVFLYLRLPDRYFFFDLTIFTRIDGIALGCIMALYKEQIVRFLRPRFRLWFVVSLVFILLLNSLFYWQMKYHWHLGWFIAPLGADHGTLANLFIGIVVLYSVFGPKHVWYAILNSSVFNIVGVLSYSIYLWQQMFLLNAIRFGSMPARILFIAMAATFSYLFVEKPFLRLRDKFRPKPVDQLAIVKARQSSAT